MGTKQLQRQTSLSSYPEKQETESAGFPGDTLVVCGNGSFANITFMEPGAVVMSRCEITGELAPKRVVRVCESSAKYYAISLNYGPAHFEQYGSDFNPYLYATGEHPFWVANKGWTLAKELTAGDVMFVLSGDPTTIDYVLTPEQFAKRRDPSFAASAAPVYNLEVEDFNTYFVGAGRIWVHNCNKTKPNVPLFSPGPPNQKSRQ
jgi:hypothetical protein